MRAFAGNDKLVVNTTSKHVGFVLQENAAGVGAAHFLGEVAAEKLVDDAGNPAVPVGDLGHAQ